MRHARALVCAALVVAGSCTDTAPAELPSASDAARSFVTALSDGDFDTVAGLIAPGDAAHWPAARLKRFVTGALAHGAIGSVSITTPGATDQPDPRATETPGIEISTTAPYSIAFESSAAAHPAPLSGELDLTYDTASRSWGIHWDKRLLWPGIPGGRGFEVEFDWSPRRDILDRHGRALATGDGLDRSYPFGALAGSTVGHLEPRVVDVEGAPIAPDADTAPARSGATVLAGASGLEAAFDRVLAGIPTSTLEVVDRKGKVLRSLGRQRGRHGRSVRTTLDVDVQRAAAAGFGDTTGGAVVLDPSTGDVLAVVSSAEFDPNNYVGVEGIHPFNRALSGLYPPGSSMKVVTASAALDAKVVTPDTVLSAPKDYKGVRNFEAEHFDSLSFADALKFSVNTVFAQVAEKLGAKRLTDYAKAFGFNRSPAMLLGAARPSFPFPADLGDVMWSSVGQAQVLATPLQMATVAATVANGGKRMEPRIDMRADPTGVRAVTRRTAATMTTLMEGVVTGGTGAAARISGVDVAGKTGTAEVDVNGERKNHAWFVCFAPAGAPKVAVAVVSEYGGVGGEVAAPLARNILVGVLPLVR